jgi:hypothetical protein
VYRALKAKGYRVVMEVTMGGGIVSVDMVVLLEGGRKVVVEVDGPLHFFVNRPEEPTGYTKLKRRLLDVLKAHGELQGWVSVVDASNDSIRRVVEAIEKVRRGR